MRRRFRNLRFFFFNDTATTEIYTLSLHDALPILPVCRSRARRAAISSSGSGMAADRAVRSSQSASVSVRRSEEHTSELQSRQYLVCRLLLEKKKLDEMTDAILDGIDWLITRLNSS